MCLAWRLQAIVLFCPIYFGPKTSKNCFEVGLFFLIKEKNTTVHLQVSVFHQTKMSLTALWNHLKTCFIQTRQKQNKTHQNILGVSTILLTILNTKKHKKKHLLRRVRCYTFWLWSCFPRCLSLLLLCRWVNPLNNSLMWSIGSRSWGPMEADH